VKCVSCFVIFEEWMNGGWICVCMNAGMRNGNRVEMELELE